MLHQNKDIQYTIERGVFTLFGSLVSEDAKYFFKPAINRLKLIVEGKRDLVFDFKFDYYNTSATIYITEIIDLLEKLSLSAKVRVNWFYDKEDEIIEELGQMYSETSKININTISYNGR